MNPSQLGLNDMGICKECGKELRGRSDKKFCSDMCRNSFHNKKRRTDNIRIAEVNKILLRNNRIFNKYISENEVFININQALDEGVDLTHFTSIQINPSGETCFVCYDTGFVIKSRNMIKITKMSNS